MLDKQKDIDAIIVATPDHMHAVIASNAMDVGKHVYVQKPLCWSVHEARHLREEGGREEGRHADGQPGALERRKRGAVEYIMAGAIGDVREVHVWTNRPLGYWPQGVPRPAAVTAIRPASAGTTRPCTQRLAAAMNGNYRPYRVLAWDLFLGVAPEVRVPPDLSPVQLARLGRLGPGRARRHGRASDRLPGVGAGARAADGDRNESTPFNGASYPSATTTYYEFPTREGSRR